MLFKQFAALLKKDLKVIIRNNFLGIVILLAVLYILAVHFLLPSQLSVDPDFYVVDLTTKGIDEELVDFGHAKIHKAKTREDVLQNIKSNKYSVGLVFNDNEVEMIFQGSISNKIKNILIATLQNKINETYEITPPNIKTQILKPHVDYKKPPFNKMFVPVFLYSEIISINMFLIAVHFFMEKEEGSIRAYKVTGSKMTPYVLSKSISIVAVSIIFSIVLTVFTLGFKINWVMFLFVVALGSLFAGLLGLITSSFFRNFQQYIYPSIGLMTLITLPMISYLFPSFSPAWLRIIPSYTYMFALKELLFPVGNSAVVKLAVYQHLVINLGLFVLAALLLEGKLATRV